MRSKDCKSVSRRGRKPSARCSGAIPNCTPILPFPVEGKGSVSLKSRLITVSSRYRDCHCEAKPKNLVSNSPASRDASLTLRITVIVVLRLRYCHEGRAGWADLVDATISLDHEGPRRVISFISLCQLSSASSYCASVTPFSGYQRFQP